MALKLWTVSYDGRSAEEIVSIAAGATASRGSFTSARWPATWKGAGSRIELKKELEDAGIEFEHVDGVGQPPEFRGIAADRAGRS